MLYTLVLAVTLPAALDYAVQVEVARALTQTAASCTCSPCHCKDACSCSGGLCSCGGCGLAAASKDTDSDSYARAYAQALRQQKPLVVWVGGNYGDRCATDSKDEFVHAFVADGWNGNRGPATVIYVPHEGDLYRAGTVRRWTAGPHDGGHVPSVRRIVAEWRVQASQGNRGPLNLVSFGNGQGPPAGRPQARVFLATGRGQSC